MKCFLSLTRINKAMLFILTISILPSVNAQTSLLQCENHLLTVERDGSISAGAHQKLLAAYRKGASIRIGWELDWNNDDKIDVTHWTSAQFMSEFQGVIFSQIPSIQQQRPVKSNGEIIFPEKSRLWFGLLNSKGKLTGRYSESKGMSKEYNVRSLWCIDS